MWGERNCQSFKTAVGGIEQPSPRLTVRRSIARPTLPLWGENSKSLLPLALTTDRKDQQLSSKKSVWCWVSKIGHVSTQQPTHYQTTAQRHQDSNLSPLTVQHSTTMSHCCDCNCPTSTCHMDNRLHWLYIMHILTDSHMFFWTVKYCNNHIQLISHFKDWDKCIQLQNTALDYNIVTRLSLSYVS